MSVLSKISILSQIGPRVAKLACQGYQIVKWAKSCRRIDQHGKNINSKPDFNYEPDRTEHSKVSRSGLPDCEVGQKLSKDRSTCLECQF